MPKLAPPEQASLPGEGEPRSVCGLQQVRAVIVLKRNI